MYMLICKYYVKVCRYVMTRPVQWHGWWTKRCCPAKLELRRWLHRHICRFRWYAMLEHSAMTQEENLGTVLAQEKQVQRRRRAVRHWLQVGCCVISRSLFFLYLSLLLLKNVYWFRIGVCIYASSKCDLHVDINFMTKFF